MTREGASEQGQPLVSEPVPKETQVCEGCVASERGEEGREVGGEEGAVGEVEDRETGGALEQLLDLLVALCV